MDSRARNRVESISLNECCLSYFHFILIQDEEHRNTFNMQQLEDCDASEEDDVKLFSVNVFNGKVDLIVRCFCSL